MDLDRYIAAHEPEWDRLAALTAAARRGVRRMPAEQLDELLSLYHRASAQLSHARGQYDDPGLTRRLTSLVAAAHVVIYGTRARSLRSFVTFFSHSFPAAVWCSRRFVLAAFLLTSVPASVMALWLANSDAALDAAAPEAVRQTYVEQDFEAYYSSDPAAEFATSVTVNNIRVSILAFAAGILLCVGTAFILVLNGGNVGVAAGLFAAAGASPTFFGLILPHGLLELTAVVIAGAAGLRLGWTIIDPGDRPRGTALAEEGRRSVVIVLGLAVAFVIAGTIEGFVTGSSLPTMARVGVGVAVEAAFLSYVVVQGRAATAAGFSGRIGENVAVSDVTRRRATDSAAISPT